MIRYAVVLLLAALAAGPARALTVDAWTAFDRDLLDRVDEDRLPVEPGTLLPDDRGAPDHGMSDRTEIGGPEADGRILSINDSAPVRAGMGPDLSIFADLTEAPATDLRSEPFVPVAATPLPPSFWLFVTALAGGLLLTRRRIAYSDPEDTEHA